MFSSVKLLVILFIIKCCASSNFVPKDLAKIKEELTGSLIGILKAANPALDFNKLSKNVILRAGTPYVPLVIDVGANLQILIANYVAQLASVTTIAGYNSITTPFMTNLAALQTNTDPLPPAIITVNNYMNSFNAALVQSNTAPVN